MLVVPITNTKNKRPMKKSHSIFEWDAFIKASCIIEHKKSFLEIISNYQRDLY